jgi:hypothetical protein
MKIEVGQQFAVIFKVDRPAHGEMWPDPKTGELVKHEDRHGYRWICRNLWDGKEMMICASPSYLDVTAEWSERLALSRPIIEHDEQKAKEWNERMNELRSQESVQ